MQNAPMSFDYSVHHSSARLPVFARNVVATSHPLAAQAGLAMLRAGGNAVDAAIAGAAAMTLLEPCSNGLGSDAFCILWDGAAAARAERVGARPGGLDARLLRAQIRRRRRHAAAPRLGLGDGARRGVGAGRR